MGGEAPLPSPAGNVFSARAFTCMAALRLFGRVAVACAAQNLSAPKLTIAVGDAPSCGPLPTRTRTEADLRATAATGGRLGGSTSAVSVGAGAGPSFLQRAFAVKAAKQAAKPRAGGGKH